MDKEVPGIFDYEAKVITTYGVEYELTDRITRAMRGGWRIVGVLPSPHGQVTVFMQRPTPPPDTSDDYQAALDSELGILEREPPKGET